MQNSKTTLTFPDNNSLRLDGVRRPNFLDALRRPAYATRGIAKMLLKSGRRGSLRQRTNHALIATLATLAAAGFLAGALVLAFTVADVLGWWAGAVGALIVYAAFVAALSLGFLLNHVYYTTSGKAYLAIKQKGRYWWASEHVSVSPGEGKTLRVALAHELVKTGAGLRLTAGDPYLAEQYKRDIPSLTEATDDDGIALKPRFGHVRLILPARGETSTAWSSGKA